MAKKKPLPAGHSFETGCTCAECKHKHYSELGARGGKKNKSRHGKAYFSKLAKRSHPKNNPDAKRGIYTGGRPRKPHVVDLSGTQ